MGMLVVSNNSYECESVVQELRGECAIKLAVAKSKRGAKSVIPAKAACEIKTDNGVFGR